MSTYYKITDSLNLKEIGKYPRVVAGGRIGNILQGHEGNYGPIKIDNPISPIIPIHEKTKLADYFGGGDVKKYISPEFYDFLTQYLSDHQAWDLMLTNDVYRFDRKNFQYVLKENIIQEFYHYKILHISYPKQNIIDYSKSSFYSYLKLNEFVDYDKEPTLSNELKIEYEKISRKNNEKVRVNKKKVIDSNLLINSRADFNRLLDSYNSIKKEKSRQEWGDIPIIGISKMVFRCSTIELDIFRLFEKGISGLSGYYVSKELKNKIEEQRFTGLSFKPLAELNPHIEIEEV